MQRPMLPYFLALMTGICLGTSISLPNLPLQLAVVLTLLAVFLASRNNWSILTLGASLFTFFLIGILLINIYLWQPLAPNHIYNFIGRDKVTCEGIISDNVQVKNTGATATVKVLKVFGDDSITETTGLVRLTLKEPHKFPDSLKYGDYIRFSTRLKPIRNFHNPGSFDFARQFRARGILVRGFINDPAGLILLRENQGNPFRIKLEKLRGYLHDFIVQNTGSEAGAIILAMTLGKQQAIPTDLRDKFSRTGTAHILSISGLHVGIIAFLSLFIITALLKSAEYLMLRFNIFKVATVIAILPVILYAFIAGGRIPVVRASIMILVFMMALILDRKKDLINSLAIAGLLILIVAPYSLFDISFQLSFSAVAAILLITPVLLPDKPTPERSRLYRWAIFPILAFSLVSLSATLGIWPIIAYYFHFVSNVSLIANLFAIPILGFFALPCSLLALAVLPLSLTAATFLLTQAAWLVDLTIWLINFFDSLPFSSVIVPPPSLTQLLMYYLFVLLGIKYLNEAQSGNAFPHKRFLKSALAILVITFVTMVIYEYFDDSYKRDLTINAIDVAQGSSTLIEFPYGKRMLIDGGGSPEDGGFDMGKNVVAPFLLHRRIKRIDIAVLTHPHSDHLNGLLYILEKFNVSEVWSNGQPVQTEAYERFLRIIKDKGITHKVVSAQTPQLFIGGVSVQVLNPQYPVNNKAASIINFHEINNNSLVLKLTLREAGILFAADIMAETENRLSEQYRHVRSRVLFVPHHGSNTSSTEAFVQAVNPEKAVISCGYDNVFSLPHPLVLKRYKTRGTKVMRTDLHGAITISTDGFHISAQSYLTP